jgi:hypothetical protein
LTLPDLAFDFTTAAGLSVVVWVIMTVLRNAISAPAFDQKAPAIAAVIGTIIAVVYYLLDGGTADEALLNIAIIGAAAGLLSQNVNNLVQRAAGNTPKKNL